MTQALTITGYVGRNHREVADVLESDVRPIESALRSASERVEELDGTAPVSTLGVERQDGALALRGAPDLEGAELSVAPVGADDSGLTSLTLRLRDVFTTGEIGRRQFLAATHLVDRSASALEERLAS